MVFSALRRFANRTLPASRQVRRGPRRSRLRCEELEPRLQPSFFFFASGVPDGRIATISEPGNAHNSHVEYESADDFVLGQRTKIVSATFAGILTGGATLSDVSNVVVEIYRVFPNDSDVGRTSGPPTFSTPQVPTRFNSPSDVAFDSRDSAANELTIQASVLNASFTTQNSVSSADKISVKSGGNGPASGEEVAFTVTFQVPFDLPADHYFFVPQVGLKDTAPRGADFLWLSTAKPIQPPGTPFNPDLQSWMRDDPPLAPDWLRIGTDIIGGITFNASFALDGDTVTDGPTGTAARSAAVDSLFTNQAAQLLNGLLGTPTNFNQGGPTGTLGGTNPAPVNLQPPTPPGTGSGDNGIHGLQNLLSSGAASGHAHPDVNNWNGDFIPAIG
jgi:hypothetical protein